jgi:hypothetical protein
MKQLRSAMKPVVTGGASTTSCRTASGGAIIAHDALARRGYGTLSNDPFARRCHHAPADYPLSGREHLFPDDALTHNALARHSHVIYDVARIVVYVAGCWSDYIGLRQYTSACAVVAAKDRAAAAPVSKRSLAIILWPPLSGPQPPENHKHRLLFRPQVGHR